MITLNELYAMQNEVKLVKVPNSINEIMDDILCALRRKDIHISDRKIFNIHLLFRRQHISEKVIRYRLRI